MLGVFTTDNHYDSITPNYLAACLTRRVEAQLRWQAAYQGSTAAFLNA